MRRVQDLGQFEAQFSEIIKNGLDKRIFIETVTPAPFTEFALEHGLSYVPIGFLVISKNKAADVFLSTTPATVANIYLQCTVASAAIRIMIF